MIDMQKGIYMSTTDFVRFLSIVKNPKQKQKRKQRIAINRN